MDKLSFFSHCPDVGCFGYFSFLSDSQSTETNNLHILFFFLMQELFFKLIFRERKEAGEYISFVVLLSYEYIG